MSCLRNRSRREQGRRVVKRALPGQWKHQIEGQLRQEQLEVVESRVDRSVVRRVEVVAGRSEDHLVLQGFLGQ